MKLFLISQTVNNDYDTYDSAVVCAENEDDAKSIRPDGHDAKEYFDKWGNAYWCRPEDVVVKYIGEAAPESTRGVVCASFNAG